MERDDRFSKDNLKRLVEGTLHWEEVKKAIRLSPKDSDRFWKYLEVLQEKVPWDDKILLRISDHLYIVAKEDGSRITKCDCGYEFGDYRINWKLGCKVYVRKTDEEIETARASGFTPVSLGARVLRTETAAMAAVTVAQYALGDLGG